MPSRSSGNATRVSLTTMRSSGRPQQSNIIYTLGADDVPRISVTDGREDEEVTTATHGEHPHGPLTRTFAWR